MAKPKGFITTRFHRRRTTILQNFRCNHDIRISPIRLIDEDDNQAGIIDTRDALKRAVEADLDLVEVSPQARPPVCKIMDFGKFKYAQSKKEQKAKAHRHETELKEVRIKTPKIGDHDLEIKLNHAREFLERSDRVQFSLRFRGRELAHIDEGRNIFEKIKKDLSDCSKVDQNYRFESRRLVMILAPLPNAVAKPKKPASKPKAPDAAEPKPAAAEARPEASVVVEAQPETENTANSE
jgi:translation initiation factor IF-3